MDHSKFDNGTDVWCLEGGDLSQYTYSYILDMRILALPCQIHDSGNSICFHLSVPFLPLIIRNNFTDSNDGVVQLDDVLAMKKLAQLIELLDLKSPLGVSKSLVHYNSICYRKR